MNVLISKINLMDFSFTDDCGEKVSFSEWGFGRDRSFGKAIILGTILGLFPGTFLALAYTSFFFVNEISTILVVDSFLVLSSSMLGGILGAFIYLNILAMEIATKLFGLISSIITSIFVLLANSIIGWISLILIPLLYLCHKYLSGKLPQWTNMAIDNFMASLIKNLFLIGLIWLVDRMTGNSLSHWAMANVETKAFIDRLHTFHGKLLHLIK